MKIYAADLFCGAGGFSTGLLRACKALGFSADLTAVNHWPVAVATHTANHPNARHMCETLEHVDPRKVIPGGRLHLLVASPECTHHSRARGGKPMSDQSRATAWHILRWCEALNIDNVLVENVKEFRDWGPLGVNGKPLKSKKGLLFEQFVRTLEALGYKVDHRVLNAAHYGAATSRERLFIQARRGHRKIKWPEATHSNGALFGAQPFRTAREIIDWSIEGKSIYGRKKPLSDNTLARIQAGLHKYSGIPFAIPVTHGGGPTRCYDLGSPLPTVTGAHRGEMALIEPFLVVLRNNCDALSVDGPVPTITAGGNHIGVAEPFLVKYHGNHKGKQDGASRVYSLDEPMKTLDTQPRFGLVEPFLVKYYGGHDACSVDDPLPTVTANYEHFGLCQPFLVEYYGNGGARSVSEPLATVTTKDRFGLVSPELINHSGEVAMLDIRFRMLQPHELAAAMGFPSDYHFEGNRENQVKQIGNAVEVNKAAALCHELLSDYKNF